MKTKSFLLGAAALMLATACSNDEVVKVAENSAAIGFSSFVNNSTRAEYGSKQLPASLGVYGVSSRTADGINPFIVFNNKEVKQTGTKEAPKWEYTPLVYWVGGNAYTFAAVAPYDASGVVVTPGTNTVGGGIESIEFTNAGDVDLLYDTQDVATAAINNSAVEFNLNHMLTRVRFEFTNGMPEGYKIKVTPLQITNAETKANLDPSAKTWSSLSAADGITLKMDNEEAESTAVSKSTPAYLFPTVYSAEEETTKAYDVTFDIEMYIKDAQTGNYVSQKVYKHKVTIPAQKYQQGYSYAFKTTINNTNIDPENEMNPILFEAAVEDWVDATKPETEKDLPKTEANN